MGVMSDIDYDALKKEAFFGNGRMGFFC